MAILDTNEANILDAETINWRLVVYPLLALAIIAVAGFGYYYYTVEQRDELEAKARTVLVQATTPEDLLKVAKDYPQTSQGMLALMAAADASFAKRDFEASIQDYQQVIAGPKVDPTLLDSAQLGLASALEANGKPDDAIKAYMVVGARGTLSPFAPYACISAARIYEMRGDKTNERQILTQAASLDPDSNFVKVAKSKLNELSAPTPPPAAAMNASNTAPVPSPTPPLAGTAATPAAAPGSAPASPPVSAAPTPK